MKTFDVLRRDQKIYQHSILEASAGTGKTFAIENIVSRLLIEERLDDHLKTEPLLIEKILIVTFTNAATSELKCRIRSKLESDLSILRNDQTSLLKNVPDYLLSIIENGKEAVKNAAKRIYAALVNFDKAKIFTIHSFCYRMLRQYSVEAKLSFKASMQDDGSYEHKKIMSALHDFLTHALKMPKYSAEQLKIIAANFQYDEEKLKRAILKVIEKGMPIAPCRTFSELFEAFKKALFELKANDHFNQDSLQADLYTLSYGYKLHDREKRLKPQYIKLIESLSELFQKNEWNEFDFETFIASGLITMEGFTKENLRVKPLRADLLLHNVDTLKKIEEHLHPIALEAKDPSFLFSRVVADGIEFIENFQAQEEMIGHSSLLKKMDLAVKNLSFKNRVRENFSHVIVDEFQDTDPLQWEIFSTLFLEKSDHPWKGYLTLVGDPKQSIYAFRQADIYTYLSAVNILGEEALSTLTTNYRSHPRLVEALNRLFKKSSNLFALPRLSKTLDFKDALSPPIELKGDDEQRLEFWLIDQVKDDLKNIERDYIFPQVVSEIVHHCKVNEKPLSTFAILVADRYQAKRVSEYLKDCHITVKTYKGKSFAGSNVILQMKELIEGVLNYESQSHLKLALAGKMIAFNHEELVSYENEDKLLKIFRLFGNLKTTFFADGFFAFISKFMECHFHENKGSVLENLISSSGNEEFYREWQDLSDFLSEEEKIKFLKPQDILELLEEIYQNKNLDNERLQAYIDAAKDGVSVLTVHASKGLEFDHVVALGLINKKSETSSGLIPVYQEGKLILAPSTKQDDPNYLKYSEEIDAEKLRQLYVALTRAKYKLYIPFVVYERGDKSAGYSFASASPIELLVAKLKANIHTYEELYETLKTLDSSTLNNFQLQHQDLIALKVLQKQAVSENLLVKLKKFQVSLFPPPAIQVTYQKKLVQSYVSIAEHSSGDYLQIDKDVNDSEELSEKPPHDFDHETKNCHTLPSGSEIGILLHEILEILLLNNLKFNHQKEIAEYIEVYTKETKYHAWNDVIADVLFNALNTEIKSPFHTFSIKDVPLNKIYTETEFLMPYTKELQKLIKVDVQAEFIKGVIDLIFEYEGKYYLIDWKSNWLGSCLEAYQPQNLSSAMEKNQYHLQASIYMHAMERYIKLFDKRPFAEVFGGCYYLFLRGLSRISGIYSIKIGVSDA